MRAAIIKTSHVLDEKAYLRSESDGWFDLQFMIYVQWTRWEWEKNSEINEKNKEKLPRLVTLPFPVSKIWDWDCAEESSVGIYHMRTSPSIVDTPT